MEGVSTGYDGRAVLSNSTRAGRRAPINAVTAGVQRVGEAGSGRYSMSRSRHPSSELAAAAMIRILDRAMAFIDSLAAKEPARAIEQLKAVARWTMQVQLAGEMPSLPAQNSSLRAALTTNKIYLDRLMEVSDRLGAWIGTAQTDRDLNPELPPEVILYTLFARACDPVLGLLKLTGQYNDEQIIELLVSTCFDGLSRR